MATDMAQERDHQRKQFQTTIRECVLDNLPNFYASDLNSMRCYTSLYHGRGAFEFTTYFQESVLVRLCNETATAVSDAATPPFISALSALQTKPQDMIFEELRRVLPHAAEAITDVLTAARSLTATEASDRLRPRSEDPEAVLEITNRMKEDMATAVGPVAKKFVQNLTEALHAPMVHFQMKEHGEAHFMNSLVSIITETAATCLAKAMCAD